MTRYDSHWCLPMKLYATLVHFQARSSDPQITQITQIGLPKAINNLYNLCNLWTFLH
jgi:hypothetical protein